MGNDESHFNVSLIVRDKVTRQCPQTATFGEKGEPKRYRTEVPLLTSLTPYRWATPAHTTTDMDGRPLKALRRPRDSSGVIYCADSVKSCGWDLYKESSTRVYIHSSGAVWKSRWPSWAPRPNEPCGFCGRKGTLNHAYALVTFCP